MSRTVVPPTMTSPTRIAPTRIPSARILPALVAAGLGLTGCVDDNADSGLVLLRNIAPATACLVTADSTEFRSSGTIQSDSSSGYLFTPVLRNDLVLTDGESATRKIIFLEGARVSIRFYDADFVTEAMQTAITEQNLARFVVPISGAIDPDGGLATFLFEIVPRELIDLIDAQFVAAGTPNQKTLLDVTVEMYGNRSGTEVASNPFHYPVEVCFDCVRQTTPLPCAMLDENFEARTGGTCNPLQDGALDCCTTATGGLQCPAAPPGGTQTKNN